MIVRRLGRLTAMVLPILLWMACGQVYRPVVIPCSEGGIPGCPVETNPQPSNFHTVFSITTNAPSYPGGAMQIDVSGDSIIGETPTYDPSKPNLGGNPTYAAISPNNSRVFVASAGSVVSGGVDVLSFFSPVFQSTLATGLGTVSTISLPAGSQPVFVNSTQATAMYVANFGTNSVSVINTASNVLSNTVPVGVNPVGLAETPNAFKLYVANQGGGNSVCGPVCSLNPTDLSQNTVTGFIGVNPVWVVARGDSQKVYVLTAGDGQLVTIDVATDTVTSSLPVGVGANFIFFDPHLNRLYVTNPTTETVYVFSDTGPGSDVPTLLAAIPFAVGSVSCPTGCMPVSVTALGDGSRFYVASYQSYQPPATCPDLNVTGACIIPGLTVFDANSLTVKYPSAPTLTLLSPTASLFAATQYAVPPVLSCATAPLYSPTTTRFRVFAAASTDSSRVYMSMCDAGAVAVINTTGSNTNNSGAGTPPDSLVLDFVTAPAACIQPTCSNNATASITAFSISSNVVTFQAANTFAPGQKVSISGLTTGTYLDGLTLTVLSAGLSGSQFECSFTHADVGPPLTPDSGIAVPLNTASITAFSITSNVVTFQAANTFVPGQTVSISGLTTGTYLDGLTLTVLATGLSRTQFECSFAFATEGLTSDSGTAIALPPPQTPIFLLTGQ